MDPKEHGATNARWVNHADFVRFEERINERLDRLASAMEHRFTDASGRASQTWRWMVGLVLAVLIPCAGLIGFALNSAVAPLSKEMEYLASSERVGALEARVDVLQGVTPTAAASPLMDRLTIDLQRVLDRQDRQIAWMMQVSALLDSHGVKPPKVPTE